MSKHRTVTWHNVDTVDNDMFDHMNDIMWVLAMKKTQWKEDLHFTMKFA